MSSVAGTSSCSTPAEVAIAMQKKMNNNVEEQGKAAVQLIEAAAPQLSSSGNVGTLLHAVG